jgi:hypothetical protein
VITNVGISEIHELAHIMPYKDKGTETIENGLALHSDIHMLSDTNLLRISESGDVHVMGRLFLNVSNT